MEMQEQKMSQCTIIGLPQPGTWDEFERGCLATFHAGYRDQRDIDIYRGGMSTIFNLLRDEFPEAMLCKAAPDLLAAAKRVVMVRHTFTSLPGGGEQCARCGRNYRDEVHYRTNESQTSDIALLEAAIAKAQGTKS